MEIELIYVEHGICRIRTIYEDGSTKLSGKGSKKMLGEAIKAEILKFLDKQENFKMRLFDGKNWYDQSLSSKEIRKLIAESAA